MPWEDANFRSGLKLSQFMDRQRPRVSRQFVSVKPEGDLPAAGVSRGLPSQHAVKRFSPFQAGLTQTGQERAINH